MEKAGLDPEKPPATNDEYMAALDKVKTAGIEGSWATPFPFTGSMWFQSLVWQFGGQLFDEGAKTAKFAEDPGVQALTWYVDLVKKRYSPKNVAQDADVVALRNGKNALNWNGIWTINTLKEDKNLQWGAAPVPQIGTQKAVWAGSHQFVQYKQRQRDDNKLTAGKVFINWISQKSLEWAKGGQVPAPGHPAGRVHRRLSGDHGGRGAGRHPGADSVRGQQRYIIRYIIEGVSRSGLKG